MGMAILFFFIILFSFLGGITCAVICCRLNRSQVNKENVFSEDHKEPSESPKDTKTDNRAETPSCLSKIDKSASFSDFMIEVDGLDEAEHSKLLRESQDDKYKRRKQEG